MTPHQLLVVARDLIADPAHWTKGAFARNANGARTSASDPAACRFCSAGALLRANLKTSESTADTFNQAVRLLTRETGGLCISAFNDHRTHPKVLAMFDRAISAAALDAPSSRSTDTREG